MNLEDENDYIIIPNPIYDVVFKYLMEDNESAKIIISTLINEKIKKLVFEPISHAEKIKAPDSEKEIKLFHLDFTATIAKPDGSEELIMIEIQKANETSDIFRFKRYISANFQKKQEVEIVNPETQAIKIIQQPIRLLPIFILNFRIENEINDLIIQTNRIKYGVFREKSLERNNEFIDNLSYDIWVVQLPNINKISALEYEKDEYKSKLYALLKLFDQEATENEQLKNRHRLRLFRKVFPNFLERVVKRLQAASSENPNLEEQMYAEDEYLKELIERSNTINFYKQKFAETSKELEVTSKELEVTSKELEETSKELEAEKHLREEKEKALSEQEKMLSVQEQIIIQFAKTLKMNGLANEEIQKQTGLAMDLIEKL